MARMGACEVEKKKETRASLPEEEYDGVELDRAGVELEHGVGDGYGVDQGRTQKKY